MNDDSLQHLASGALRSLAGALRDGPLADRVSMRVLQQIVGAQAGSAERALAAWAAAGMAPAHIAILLEAIADTKDQAQEPASLVELVLSGPDVPGIPTRDTAAAIHALIEEARQEVLLVGYAVHNGQKLFGRLAERMSERPDLRVVFCLDISRSWSDTSLSSEIVRRFAHEFATKHWPWTPVPEVYYDPRSLDTSHEQRSCLHAKCVVVDRRQALITSANFTEAAQQRNIETGVIVRHSPVVARLAGYLDGLIAEGLLRKCRVEETCE